MQNRTSVGRSRLRVRPIEEGDMRSRATRLFAAPRRVCLPLPGAIGDATRQDPDDALICGRVNKGDHVTPVSATRLFVYVYSGRAT